MWRGLDWLTRVDPEWVAVSWWRKLVLALQITVVVLIAGFLAMLVDRSGTVSGHMVALAILMTAVGVLNWLKP